MKTTSRRKVDAFSLFNVTSLPDSTFLETKHFLSEKFLISFDSIKDDIANSKTKNSENNIIEIIYNAVYSNVFGYSLSMVNNTTYGVYTHKYTLLSTNHALLMDLDSQIKFHCIVESLYTAHAILNSTYMPLAKLPLSYTSKGYINKSNGKLIYPFLDYSSADDECIDKLRYAYNTLLEPLSQIPTDSGYADLVSSKFKSGKFNPKDMTEFGIAKIPNCLLANAFNYSDTNSSYQVQEFLKEFSFDLLVNQTQQGFNLVKKLKTIQNNRQQPNHFRREVRRFLTDMETIDDNFFSTSDSIETLLYNWKKDHVFHLYMLSYLISSQNNYIGMPYAENLLLFPTLMSFSPLIKLLESISAAPSNEGNIIFLLRYLSEITIPVFSYTFFIALYESLEYSLENIQRMLTVYLRQHSISIESSGYFADADQLNTKSIDQLGNILLNAFWVPPFSHTEPFDSSFSCNLPCAKEYIDDLKYIQSDVGLKYYENILC